MEAQGGGEGERKGSLGRLKGLLGTISFSGTIWV